MSDPIKLLSDAIVDNGFRLTLARKAVVDALVQCGGHVSADDLAAQVRANAPQVGRMTVYRTLELLTSLGVIQTTYQGTGAAHYILLEEGSHHHLLCRGCQKVIEFEHCGSSEIAEQIAAQFNFKIQGHLLEVYGLCEACAS